MSPRTPKEQWLRIEAATIRSEIAAALGALTDRSLALGRSASGAVGPVAEMLGDASADALADAAAHVSGVVMHVIHDALELQVQASRLATLAEVRRLLD